jgi:ribosome-associated protein
VTRELAIRGETIRLGQLLKLAGLIDGGGEAKAFLAATPVLVNGEREQRRGRQLRAGDEVTAGGESVTIARFPSRSEHPLERGDGRDEHRGG